MILCINGENSDLIKSYIKLHGLSISAFAHQSMLEPIEDEYDLAILRQAMAEDDGVRISHEDLMAAEFAL